jgi:hypothetical protein
VAAAGRGLIEIRRMDSKASKLLKRRCWRQQLPCPPALDLGTEARHERALELFQKCVVQSPFHG